MTTSTHAVTTSPDPSEAATPTRDASAQALGSSAEDAGTLLLTLDEAAQQLRCARRSLERHIASRRLRVVHLGRSVRVERGELGRFIAQMRDRDGKGHDE